MLTWITKAAPLALAATLVFGAPAAEAATFVSTGSCSTSNVTANGASAGDCFGAARTLRSVNLNQDKFTTSWREARNTDPGLFAQTDWSFWGRAAANGTNKIDYTSNLGSTKGTWSVDAGAFDEVLRIVVVLTTATRSAAYVFENPAEITGGTWNTAAFARTVLGSQPLTDIVIYTSGLAPIPLPAGAVLMLSGFGAFGVMARRKKKKAEDAITAEPVTA